MHRLTSNRDYEETFRSNHKVQAMKTVFITILVAAMAGVLRGQGLGIRAGANLSNFSGEDIQDFDNGIGYHAGVFIPIGLSAKVSIEPALLLSVKGAKYSEREAYPISPTTELSEEFTADIKLHYIDVPINLVYRLDKHFFLAAGPSLSFLAKKKGVFISKECINGECTGMREESDDFLDFRGLDIGLNAALGFNFGEKLVLSAGYQSGLLTLSKDEDDDKVFNRSWMFSLGYKILRTNKDQ